MLLGFALRIASGIENMGRSDSSDTNWKRDWSPLIAQEGSKNAYRADVIRSTSSRRNFSCVTKKKESGESVRERRVADLCKFRYFLRILFFVRLI